MPDRVVRQFGCVQSRPLDPIVPRTAHRPMGGRGKGQYELVFDDLWDNWDHLDEHLCSDILGSLEVNPEWEVEKGYLHWFLRVSHPYVFTYATVHAPPTAHPPTAMDLTRRVAMARACAHSVLLRGHDSFSDWTYIEAVLSSAQPPPIGPLGAASDFPSIYERGGSSRTSAVDVEADIREAYRAELVVIGAERVSQQPG
ncbi:hypothetical protein V2J09_003058 [Rumex salicifolius]